MSETPHPHAVFWIDLDKITPNPYQPRKFFDPERLQDLSDSIRRYGVLQPIVVSRMEEYTAEGGMVAKYEIIAGERRFRASKLAGLEKIPAIVREGEQTDEEKLELAILENLQREDLNPVDKARSFNQLVEEFNHTHAQVAEALGKSREYVSNSLRLLQLPDYILDALSEGKITEGHTRPLLMLKERPDEQQTLFTQMTSTQGMTVRDAEKFARSIATEKQRKNKDLDPEMKEIEAKLASHLGAKVSIDKKSQGGKLTIEFGSKDDLRVLFEKIQEEANSAPSGFVSQEQNIPEPIDKLFTPEPEITKSETPIVNIAQAQESVGQDFIPAHMSDSVREINPEPAKEVPVGFEDSIPTDPHPEFGVQDLQKEIDQLAGSAQPDQFDDQAKYSLRSMRQEAQALQAHHERTADTPKPAFAFHDDVVQPQSAPDTISGRDPAVYGAQEAYIPQAQVDVVGGGSFDSFTDSNNPEPIANVDAVSMGGEFVPQANTFREVASEQRPIGSSLQADTSEFVPEKTFRKLDVDEDLYRLDNFSV